MLVAAALAALAAPDVGALDPFAPGTFHVEPTSPAPGDVVTVTYRGPLVDDPDLELVYGFDAYRVVGPGDFAKEPDNIGDLVDVGRAPLVAQGDGTAIATVELPGAVRALHLHAESPTGRDDHDGLGYGWGVVFPYAGPFLTWNDTAKPDSGVVVTFMTGAECGGVVAFGVDALDQIAVGSTVDTLHHVALTGLQPGVTYQYQVFDSLGRASDVHSFTTVPTDATDLSFLVIADMQDSGQDHERWAAVADAALDIAPDARLVFAPGDLAANEFPGYWWAFFDRARDLFGRVPLVPMPGNHDTPNKESSPDTRIYETWFDLPTSSGTEAHYTQRVGPALFVALDTERPDELAPGGAQHAWLPGALDAEADAAWVFAGMHHPAYDASDRFPTEHALYRPITELFDGRVDAVFQGHVHLPQRFTPLRYAVDKVKRYGRDAHEGPAYLVVPTAGSRIFSALALPSDDEDDLVRLLESPFSEDGHTVPSEHGFLDVRVAGDAVTVRTWGQGGPEDPQEPHVVDTLALPDPGCGCATGGPGALPWLALALPWLRRRRRS